MKQRSKLFECPIHNYERNELSCPSSSTPDRHFLLTHSKLLSLLTVLALQLHREIQLIPAR